MVIKKFIVKILFFSFIALNSQSQNLVPNPSFEQYTNCPSIANQVPYASGWQNFLGTPDYYNSCTPIPNFSVPLNFYGGYQLANTGVAYAGLVPLYLGLSGAINIREYIGCQMITPLVIGQKYFVSFKTNLGYNGITTYCATNNLGAKFTSEYYTEYATDSFNSPLTNNLAHIFTPNIVTDTLGWTTVSGSFIADSAYNYMVLGNFFDDSHTNSFSTVVTSMYQAYYFIDDVCVSIDSFICNGGNIFSSSSVSEFDPILSFFQFHQNISVIFDNSISLNHVYLNIYDISGRELKKHRLTDYHNTISCCEFPKGIYFCEIIINKQSFPRKFFVY